MDRSSRGFLKFLAQREQRVALVVMALAMAAIGVVMHRWFPLPFLFPDSGAYVLSAAHPEVFNIYRPMGYSVWLRLVHFFGESATTLFVFSWTLHSLSCLFCIFTARYLLEIRSRIVFWLLAAAAILAPRLIFSANFLMSDSLFASLTMLFVATALWMLFARNFWMLAAHLLLFALLYRVRYAGVLLVPVSVAALWLGYAGAKRLRRVAMALIPIVLLGFVASSAQKEYARETGVDTSSGFGGWQLINNASVLLPEARSLAADHFPREQQLLHQFLASYPDSLFSTQQVMSTDLMWNNALPYKVFLGYYIRSTGRPYQRSWVEVGRLYGDYARGLIGRYPLRYAVRYWLPSLRSSLRCGTIGEADGGYLNQELFAGWFGIDVERHDFPAFFASLTPLRHGMNVVYWVALLGVAAVWCLARRLAGERFDRRAWAAAGLLLGFVVIFVAGSAVGSPNTTWRYTMPVFVPSLPAMAWAAQQWVTRRSVR